MKYGLADYVRKIADDKRRQHGGSNSGPAASHLEVTVERAIQGARRCRRCAAVYGRYVCIPSAAVRNEWRHSDSGVELIVHLLTCHAGGTTRLQTMIHVKNGSQSHARAVYAGDLLTAELPNGPWTLKLISEESECDFVFPGQLEVVSSGKLPTSRNCALVDNAR
jgi:hypothetical protein